MGTSKSTQNSTQQSTSTQNPWDQAMPAIQGILGGVTAQTGNYMPTSAEQGAIGSIQNNANNAQNYGTQATGLANDLMGGATGSNAAMMNKGYTDLQGQLNPYLNADYLDPTKAPGMQSLLATIRGDVTNQVNGQFAGAGRDMSGLNTQTLARGIAQGEAQPLLAQYNANVGAQQNAQNMGYNAANTTASGLQGLTQQDFNNRFQGLDTAINGIPLAQNNQANQILQAGQTARGVPLQNLGMLEGLTLPLAGLGGTTNTTGTGQTQGSYTMSPMQQALMGSQMFKNFGFGG